MKGVVVALGIIGTIFGFFGALFALGIGGLGEAFEAEGATSVIKSGVVAILASITGLVGAVLVFGKPKLAGWLMIGSAIVGLVAVSLFYIIATVFLGIGGVLALTIKQKEKEPSKATSQ